MVAGLPVDLEDAFPGRGVLRAEPHGHRRQGPAVDHPAQRPAGLAHAQHPPGHAARVGRGGRLPAHQVQLPRAGLVRHAQQPLPGDGVRPAGPRQPALALEAAHRALGQVVVRPGRAVDQPLDLAQPGLEFAHVQAAVARPPQHRGHGPGGRRARPPVTDRCALRPVRLLALPWRLPLPRLTRRGGRDVYAHRRPPLAVRTGALDGAAAHRQHDPQRDGQSPPGTARAPRTRRTRHPRHDPPAVSPSRTDVPHERPLRCSRG